MTLCDLMAPVLRGDLYHATRPRGPAAATDPSGVVRDMHSAAEAAAWAAARAVPLSWIPQGARVLDVGCGDGKLAIARPDCTVAGYEPNDQALQLAVSRGVIREAVWPAIDADVLLLMDVVEHMSTPYADAERWLARMRPGTLVIVQCPDFWCPMAQLYGDRFRLLHDPDHVSLFTTESLVRMLRDLGVMIEDVAHPYFGGPFDTAENAERQTEAGLFDVARLSPAAPGNMVAVKGRKR